MNQPDHITPWDYWTLPENLDTEATIIVTVNPDSEERKQQLYCHFFDKVSRGLAKACNLVSLFNPHEASVRIAVLTKNCVPLTYALDDKTHIKWYNAQPWDLVEVPRGTPPCYEEEEC